MHWKTFTERGERERERNRKERRGLNRETLSRGKSAINHGKIKKEANLGGTKFLQVTGKEREKRKRVREKEGKERQLKRLC